MIPKMCICLLNYIFVSGGCWLWTCEDHETSHSIPIKLSFLAMKPRDDRAPLRGRSGSQSRQPTVAAAAEPQVETAARTGSARIEDGACSTKVGQHGVTLRKVWNASSCWSKSLELGTASKLVMVQNHSKSGCEYSLVAVWFKSIGPWAIKAGSRKPYPHFV